ncbi:MAG: hypothetical protein DHS20C11_15330 [Lysobacteraceae bacterium]|nr:MAG: hypothetical protein DHS20C11_15330 [Xanthomonadaceae bacterium]
MTVGAEVRIDVAAKWPSFAQSLLALKTLPSPHVIPGLDPESRSNVEEAPHLRRYELDQVRNDGWGGGPHYSWGRCIDVAAKTAVIFAKHLGALHSRHWRTPHVIPGLDPESRSNVEEAPHLRRYELDQVRNDGSGITRVRDHAR